MVLNEANILGTLTDVSLVFSKSHESRFQAKGSGISFMSLSNSMARKSDPLLRYMAGRAGTDADDIVRDRDRENDDLRASTLAYNELFARGDAWACHD